MRCSSIYSGDNKETPASKKLFDAPSFVAMSVKIKRQLFPYAIVVMLAFIGFSLPLPILPEMFLNGERAILPASMPMSTKTILLGLMLTAFPLGQFFGSLFLGRFSDHYGRKRVIQYSLMGSTIGYLITAYGVWSHSLLIMFLGLFFCGICEGNISIAQAAIADLTTKETRSRYFGWLNFFINAGFIIGPLIGGQLSDPSWSPGLTFATPFWVAAILTVAGMGVIALRAKETLKEKQGGKVSIFPKLGKLLSFPRIKTYYVSAFFLAMGFFYFFRYVTVYAERQYNFTTSYLGYLLAYNAVAFAVALLVFVPIFDKRLSPQNNTALFSFLLAIALIIFLIPQEAISMLWTIPFVGLFLALSVTFDAVMISTAVDERHQGQAMGVLVSIQVIAEVITSATGGFLAAHRPALPIFVGGFMCLICTGILLISGHLRKKSATL